MKVRLEKRRDEVKSQFNELEAKRKELVEQGKGIQRQLSDVQAEQVRLQGSFRELENLIGEADGKEQDQRADNISKRKVAAKV